MLESYKISDYFIIIGLLGFIIFEFGFFRTFKNMSQLNKILFYIFFLIIYIILGFYLNKNYILYPEKIYIVFKINKTTKNKSIVFNINNNNKLELPSADYSENFSIKKFFTNYFNKNYKDYNPKLNIIKSQNNKIYYIYLDTKKNILNATDRLKLKIRYEDINKLYLEKNKDKKIDQKSYNILNKIKDKIYLKESINFEDDFI